MNKLDLDYQNLLKDILENGTTKETRNGGTISVFGRQIRHKMSEGFPLLTTKKMHWKSIVTELLWFLRGDTNIKYLVDNDCHIWDGDCFVNYQKEFKKLHYHTAQMGKDEFINKIKTDDEFAKKWGSLGPVYGKQWRSWEVLHYDKTLINTDNDIECYRTYIDQIANLINELKTNPDSRRLMVSAWNVGEIDSMVLPPCHYGFQVYTRELSWYDDLDKIKEIYINWSLSKPSGGYAGDIKVDITESANQIFVDGWQEHKDPFTGNPLIELECFSSIPKRAISLMWNQRSVDTFLGLPFNIASYGLLLEIIAKEVNMIPDELIGNLGDVHLYSNHVEQAKKQIGRELTVEERGSLFRKQQNIPDDVGLSGSDRYAHRVFDDYGITKRTREPYPLPKIIIKDDYKLSSVSPHVMDTIKHEHIVLENYQSHPTIKAPLSN